MKLRSRSGKLLTLALPLALAMAVAVPALAQEDKGADRETKQTVAMSQKVYEQLVEVQALVEAKNYAAADMMSKALLAQEKLTPYELAQIWNLTAYSYYLQEKYAEAIVAYDKVMAQPELPEALMLSTLKTKAQLQFTVDDYQGALKSVEQLKKLVPEPSADIFMLEGQAWFQLGDYKKALGPVKTAVEMTRNQGQVPKENWLLLLRVCYYELQDYKNMILVLEEMIQHYPKDTYLLTLAGAHSELGDTQKQLSIVEAMYDQGLITTESHIVNLANLQLLHDAPYKAATLLDKEIKAGRVKANERNLRLLSQAFYTAREDRKSIPPLEQAAKLSEDGELYVRLAQSHLNLENWDAAAKAVERGLQLGGLSRTDTANIMLGMALFNQKKFSAARKAFEAAGKDKRSSKAAQQWVAYVESEIKRNELMQQEVPQRNTPKAIDEMLKGG